MPPRAARRAGLVRAEPDPRRAAVDHEPGGVRLLHPVFWRLSEGRAAASAACGADRGAGVPVRMAALGGARQCHGGAPPPLQPVPAEPGPLFAGRGRLRGQLRLRVLSAGRGVHRAEPGHPRRDRGALQPHAPVLAGGHGGARGAHAAGHHPHAGAGDGADLPADHRGLPACRGARAGRRPPAARATRAHGHGGGGHHA
ncbi:hypothetical protein D3C87_1441710 [compost metagenome]